MTHVPRFHTLRPSSAQQSGPAHVLTAKNTTPDRVALAICISEGAGEGFRSPLLRAVSADAIALAIVGVGQTPPLARLDRTNRPAVLVLLADDDTCRVGPDSFPYAARAMRWARKAMIHASGGAPEHYEMAVTAAQTARRLILVEICTAHAEAWTQLALRTMRPRHILRIEPRPGGVHPVPVPRDALQ